jgi:sugar lactone lactonase YvrE
MRMNASKTTTVILTAMILVLVPSLITAQTERKYGVLTIAEPRFFPEGVTVSKDGTFYVGSMEEGSIMRIRPGQTEAEPFIKAGSNGLVSVLGVYADDANSTLWACSSDAGNGKLTGKGEVGIKAFDLETGKPKGSYDFPEGGFCNDITVDTQGNVYASDSWSPRILRLATGSKELEEWVKDDQFGTEQWSLNGLDVDNDGSLYIVNQRKSELFRVEIKQDGKAGKITKISTSHELRRPDGLKVIDEDLLAVAEGGAGGMVTLKVDGDTAKVNRVSEGLNGVSTFAYLKGSAWLLENQGQHFWDPKGAGKDAKPPFRIVEIPLNVAEKN